jgi:antitoxin (DNA-binding transcriptional repressor) of toxin-antitoxin stability system
MSAAREQNAAHPLGGVRELAFRARARQTMVVLNKNLYMRSLDRNSTEAKVRRMRAVTIKEAKARLNELVEAAHNGEQVVLLRGSELVAAIVPITADDLELNLPLTDTQAEKLWRAVEGERRTGKLLTFETPEELVLKLADSATSPKYEKKPRPRASKRVGSRRR